MINLIQWWASVSRRHGRAMGVRAVALITLNGLAVLALNEPAYSQAAHSESVRERPRLDYESFGFSFRALLGDKERSGPRKPADQLTVFSRVDFGAGYNSNVLRTPNNEKASAFTSVTPRLAIHSDWDKHGVNMVLKADARVFASESKENKLDLAARVGGHYDLANDDITKWNVEVARLQAPRGSSDDAGPTFEPQVINRYTLGASFERGQDLDLKFATNAQLIRYDYERVDALSRDALDSTELNVVSAAAIASQGGINLFVIPAVRATTYDQDVFSDSIVYDMAVGWRTDTSPLTTATGRVGVTHRDFSNSGTNDITSLLLESNLLWNATPLITVRNDAFVETDDAQNEAGTGTIAAGFDIGLDYEMFDNLIFTSGFGYQNDRFQGIDRTDETFRSSFGAMYLIGDRYFIRGDLGHESRRSDVAAEEFDETTMFLRFGIKNCCLGDAGLVDAFAEGVKDVFR